jgi:hypothetical protein
MRLLLGFAALAALVYFCTDWREFRRRSELARCKNAAYGAATWEAEQAALRCVRVYSALLGEEVRP